MLLNMSFPALESAYRVVVYESQGLEYLHMPNLGLVPLEFILSVSRSFTGGCALAVDFL